MTSARSALGVTGFMNAAFGFRALFFFPVFAVFFFAVLAIYSPLEDASRRHGVVSRRFVHAREEKCKLSLGTSCFRLFQIGKVPVPVFWIPSARAFFDDDF